MAQLDEFQIILRPLVTEKGTHQAQTVNAYAFMVHARANKHQIREAVEKLYNVKVAAVRTQNRRGKPKRAGYRYTNSSDWKKAIVKLKADYHIDLF
jgi:large subunit ribosomal protein L23